MLETGKQLRKEMSTKTLYCLLLNKTFLFHMSSNKEAKGLCDTLNPRPPHGPTADNFTYYLNGPYVCVL